MTRHIHVKGVRREIVDDDKLALALWLLAKDVLADEQSADASAAALPELPPGEDEAEAA